MRSFALTRVKDIVTLVELHLRCGTAINSISSTIRPTRTGPLAVVAHLAHELTATDATNRLCLVHVFLVVAVRNLD